MTKLEIRLQRLLELSQKANLSPGVQICMFSPRLDINLCQSVGYTDFEHNPDRDLLSARHPIRIASNTKTFVAAAILRLWECGQLGLDISIDNYLSQSYNTLIRRAGYELDCITVRQLLAHTSGFFDYADSPYFFRHASENPQHIWTRIEQLRIALDQGSPYGRPGDIFRYSDTGYILLGEIIERVFGQPMWTSIRGLLSFYEQGLHSTWWEGMEDIPSGICKAMHPYDGKIDASTIHGSYDSFGGGGLISTVIDLACFFYNLFNGKVYENVHTLQEMLAPVSAKKGGPDYGFWRQVPGTYRLGIEAGKNDCCFSHRGHFGTLAAFFPEYQLSIALNIGMSQQLAADPRVTLLKGVVSLLEDTKFAGKTY